MRQSNPRPAAPVTYWPRVAFWISALGHPLLTVALFVSYAAFRLLARPLAAWVVLGVVAGVVLPIAYWNYRQVQRGTYTNFDVSVRAQRRSFYPRLLLLLGATTAGLYAAPATGLLRPGMLVATGLLTVCYGVNFWLKVSLHAALSFFVAGCLGLLAGPAWAVGAGLAAALVAGSRWVLGRHSIPELLVGAALGGLAAGVLYHL